MMPQLDEHTLHKVRHMASAGATPEYIAIRYGLPVEQVAFVCGLVPPGERGGYGGLVPEITDVERCDTGPVLPLSQCRSLPPTDGPGA
jgi:hypothetical protein